MNLTKKLIFGLLLAGALFTTACGDSKKANGETCAKDDECTSAKCDAGKCADKAAGSSTQGTGSNTQGTGSNTQGTGSNTQAAGGN